MFKSILKSLLKFFSKRIIKKYSPDVVGITGSVGKTSTKEAIAAVLASNFSVRQSAKNYNNEIGMPLTIIGVDNAPGRSVEKWLRVFGKALRLLFVKDKNYPEILALEMGADKPGDIEYLTSIAPCKAGVLTFISHAHTEFFKTIKKIAQEKRIIISHLKKDGFAILNWDSEMVMQNARVTSAEVITFGFREGADFQATDFKLILDEQTGWPTGVNAKVLHKGSVVPIFLPGAVSKARVYAALAGLSVGSAFGVNLVDGSQSLSTLAPLEGHMRIIPGIKNTLLIDDTYNSSPEATKAALECLAQVQVAPGALRYAALADMLELGAETENAHREIGFKVAEFGIDFLITVGEASKHTARSAREAGMDEHRIASFSDNVSAGKFLQEKLKEGDVALIKGSQSTRMEKVVKEVMAEPLLAKELLVRQEEWD